jgi:hypothetical protein
VLLADEVGLGKTIEAALVMCQYWAEHRRRLLVVCPASIRKQCALELEEKFNLPVTILDARAYRLAQADGRRNPFDDDTVMVVSLHFANSRREEIRQVRWDLAVIDEAHKLRNAYRASNKLGQGIRWALADTRKLLLTATPLQNSLLELYGLSTLIDEQIFGDPAAFRSRYANSDGDLDALKQRLTPFSHRTLRRQVLEYIQYTQRRAITRPFHPSDDEQRLYEAVSGFLMRDDTFSLPAQQRQLTTLILRKLLASSSDALAGTLETFHRRLMTMQEDVRATWDVVDWLIQEEEIDEELLEELASSENGTEAAAQPAIDYQKLKAEITELERYISWARRIQVDEKSRALLQALEVGFSEMARVGAQRKALIFTESRRTQSYLRRFLEANGYAGQIVSFSGSNSEPEAKAIYERWLTENSENGRATGSRTVDMRTALIEHFRDRGTLMIATEAGAEGINLQFCSLVINYDLPWNPQRIEQRIGRCHRYGQRHDVVVVNFLNTRNAADQRVYELLQDKFNLFNGVFGASDEVLGVIESGVDFEKRILAIYQTCRTAEEIDAAFQALQAELQEKIDARLADTRHKLLEYFDEDVHARLRHRLGDARLYLDRVSRMFWDTTRFVLAGRARFDDSALSFDLQRPPMADVRVGRYRMISKDHDNVAGEFLYRLSHRLGEYVVQTAKGLDTPPSAVAFDITRHPTRIALVEALRGRTGWLALQLLTIRSFEEEEYLLFSAFDDHGAALDPEACEKLFHCAGRATPLIELPSQAQERLKAEMQRHAQATIHRSLEANNQFFREEQERLDRWADDVVQAAEKGLADIKAQLKALNRQARQAINTEEQHRIQVQMRELESRQRQQRRQIFDIEDEVYQKRDALINALEKRMRQTTYSDVLFTIRWAVV